MPAVWRESAWTALRCRSGPAWSYGASRGFAGQSVGAHSALCAWSAGAEDSCHCGGSYRCPTDAGRPHRGGRETGCRGRGGQALSGFARLGAGTGSGAHRRHRLVRGRRRGSKNQNGDRAFEAFTSVLQTIRKTGPSTLAASLTTLLSPQPASG
jgi:hypothetical protein